MLELACGFDDAYLPHAAVMLHSALTRMPDAALVRVHVLHDQQLSAAGRQRFATFVRALGADIVFHLISDERMQGFPTAHFHRACWYRIFLADLLPEVERVLYLDADMVVLDDLTKLWQTALDGHWFAAVVNPMPAFFGARNEALLGLSDPLDYLNSGVLLLDLVALRRVKLSAELLKYAQAHPDNSWPEQDALSVIAQSKWLRLDPRWNAQNTFFDFPAQELAMSAEQVQHVCSNPAIVHFIGPHKPWRYLCRHPFMYHYNTHRQQTPWSDWKVAGRNVVTMAMKPLPVVWQFKLYRRLPMLLRRLAW